MTKTERNILQNLLTRLQQVNLGSSPEMFLAGQVRELNKKGEHVVHNVYLDTWIVPALEMMLKEGRSNDDLQWVEKMCRPNPSMPKRRP